MSVAVVVLETLDTVLNSLPFSHINNAKIYVNILTEVGSRKLFKHFFITWFDVFHFTCLELSIRIPID